VHERGKAGQRAQVQYRYFDEEPIALPLPPSEAALLLPSPRLPQQQEQEQEQEQEVSLPPGHGLRGAMRGVEGKGQEEGDGGEQASRPLERRQRRQFFTEEQEQDEGDGNPQSPARPQDGRSQQSWRRQQQRA
jgi:hypothetical protein